MLDINGNLTEAALEKITAMGNNPEGERDVERFERVQGHD